MHTKAVLLVSVTVCLLAGCRSNQKEDVRELEQREKSAAASVTKEQRRFFEEESETKLQRIKQDIDAVRVAITMRAPDARTSAWTNDDLRALDQMDQELSSVRMRFDQLKTAEDSNYAELKGGVASSLASVQQSWEQFARRAH